MTTTTGIKPSQKALVMHQALIYVKAMKRRQAEYDAEVKDWYTSGDGRSPKWIEVWHETDTGPWPSTINVGGKGYRFPQCIHGMSLWTDYDNGCPGCEDSLTLYEQALILAHTDVRQFNERMALYRAAADLGAPLAVREALSNWGCEVITPRF